MNGIIDFANKFFKPILDMGAPIIMLIVLTLLGASCDHYLGVCLDTLLLASYVGCQHCHACNEENRYT